MRKQQRPRVLLQRPNFLHEDLRISVLRTRSHCQTPFFSSLLVHRPGDEAQVDFFEVTVDEAGTRRKAWQFLMRLMYSGRDFAWLYDRCDQLSFLDGHVQALEYFGKVPHRSIYDNLSPAVTRVTFPRRRLTERFTALVSHYLFEPCFARVGEGHDKGGVEGRGNAVRLQHLTLIPKGKSLRELSEQLLGRLEEEARGKVNAEGKSVLERFGEELERMRAEFLGMVSHELRAPLASIKGSAATLTGSAETLDPAEMLLFFRIIEQQADQMSALITDLLDMAHIETGVLPVSAEPADPAILVDQARNTFLSGGPGNPVHIDLEPDLPRVMADRRRIVQVLNNLLSNAARHSNELSPIRVAAAQDGVHVAFSVADDGVGVPAERLPHLFRKFSRLDGEERGREIGGSGLGLAICKGIVEAHGGRIRAESDGPGLGSRFTFTVPAVEEAVTPAAPPSRRRQTKTRERPRILCVDDDPQTLRHVRDALTKAGYTPVVTGDPEEVSRLMAEEAPRLVLLDLMLPGSDGMELMKEIREVSDVPVIFLSVNGQEDVVARAFDMGAADYVVKPFSAMELVARIRAALRKRAAPELAEPSEPYVRGDLTIDYPQRRVTVAGRPVAFTAIEYRMLVELSVNAGRALTHELLLQRVWGPDRGEDSGPVRNIVKRLRRKLGDDPGSPTYILTEPRFGYRMEKGETEEREEA